MLLRSEPQPMSFIIMIGLSILIFCQNDAIQVASHKISKDYADIYAEDLKEMCLDECERHTKEIECVCNAVRKAADDEKRNSENEGKELILTGKLNGRSHDESASYGKDSAFERTCSHSEFKNLLSRLLYCQRRNSGEHRNQKTAYNVSEKYQEKISDLVLPDETCCSCV